MSYRIAGVDVHKRMLAVVVSDLEVVGEFGFERRQFGSTPARLSRVADRTAGRRSRDGIDGAIWEACVGQS